MKVKNIFKLALVFSVYCCIVYLILYNTTVELLAENVNANDYLTSQIKKLQMMCAWWQNTNISWKIMIMSHGFLKGLSRGRQVWVMVPGSVGILLINGWMSTAPFSSVSDIHLMGRCCLGTKERHVAGLHSARRRKCMWLACTVLES